MTARLPRAVLLTTPVALAAAACSPAAEKDANDGPSIHRIMRNEVDANAHALWEVTNPAIGDEAGLDPAKMTEARWIAMHESAEAMKRGALAIARMDPPVVARPGEQIADAALAEGYTSTEVQAEIDRNPAKLREAARSFASYASLLSAAAYARNAPAAGPLVDQLNAQCESCHLEFWYPAQKDLLSQASTAR